MSNRTALFDDLRLALRTMRKSPAFTVLLRPLDYGNASRLVLLNTSRQGRPFPRLTGPALVDISAGASTLERISFSYGGDMGVQLPTQADFARTYLVSPRVSREALATVEKAAATVCGFR